MYYFVHIPKAGGATLGNHFFNAFGRSNCLCVYSQSLIKDVHPDDFCNLLHDDFTNKITIQGHLRVRDFLTNRLIRQQFCRGKITTIASVRDPIERLVSLRNYIAIHKHHPEFNLVNSIEPEEFILKQVDNYQCKYLSPPSSEVDLEFIKMLIKTYPIEHGERLLRKQLEFCLNKELPQVEIKNITKSKVKAEHVFFSVADIESTTLKKLRMRHSMDITLYQNALVRWQ